MKHTKKLIVALCAVVCAFAMAVPAFAATIEVQDVLDGETYTAYKILNYTDNGKEENDRAVSYYLTADEYTAMHTVLEAAGFHFTQSADKTQWYVDNAEGFDPAAAAAYLGEHVADLGNALGKFEATGADGKAVFTDLGTGYYFVTSSMGTLCALHEDGEIATAVEKNTMITDAKTVDESSANAQVGDVLNYTITLTDGKGTNLPATVTDTLSKGLTYNADAKASINGGAATPITGEVTPQTDGSTKVVYTFDAATMTALEEGQKIVITYTATVNADASIDGTVSNTTMSGTDAVVMMAGVKDVEAAWEFMCWYTDTKFQVDYSNEMVAILGPAAKNATANQAALEELPWTSREYSQLMKQMDITSAVTQYPGSYILARYTNFAFLNAYNNNADPVDSLLEYINTINKEINRKRTEFNLETLEIGQTLASKRLGQAADAIAELDDGAKSSAPVAAASEAIGSENIEALRSAAAGLTNYPEIAGYLTDAANALESYIEYGR